VKILHLLYESRGDYFGIGGVGTRAYEIYRHLKERHDITLLCKKYPGATDKVMEGLNHIFVGTESSSLTKTLLSYSYCAASFVRRKALEFDIIIEEFSPAIPTFLPFLTKRPVVLQIQGHTGTLYYRKYNPLYALTLSVMEHLRPRTYERFIFVSGHTMKRYRLDGGVSYEIIPNGVGPEMLHLLPGDEDYILSLGRIDIYGKGLDILIRAYREFCQSFPSVKLVVAGDGRDREEFLSLCGRLPEHVRGNIVMLGWVSGDRKKEVLQKASMVVLASRHEDQPIAVLEAMAAAKAIVVSDIPAFTFVTEEGAGVSFKTGDAFSLAQSMKNLMGTHERNEMGKRGREWAKDHTWERIAEKFERFLYRVLEDQKAQKD